MASEQHGTPFETLWQASGLARVAPQLRPAATITARLAEAAALGDEGLAQTLAQEVSTASTLAEPPRSLAEGGASPQGEHASLPHITLVSDELEEGDGRAKSTVSEEKAELRVVALLGEGGMGRVLLARQRSLGRDVAVKVLKRELATPGSVEALLSEARLSGSLEHPNVVPVHALGRDDLGRPVLVMKRVEGVSWRALLDDPQHEAWANVAGAAAGEGRLDAHLEILADVCNALHFAHSKGVVHRDVKPENVLIGSFGEVYVADWGIALRVGEASRTVMVGTPGYMAPEMLSGDPSKVDARTDVFLLGATLHEVLTGRMRHEGVSVYEALVNAFDCAPPKYPSTVPAELGDVAAKATARDPGERYEDARALRDALSEYRRHRGSHALALTAAARLDELRAAAEKPADADVRAVHRLGTECRFGFAQALRDWPGNTVAKYGLRDALSVLARFELARENAEAAGALLDELGSRAPEYRALREAHDALRKRLDERREREGSLRAMERELDLRVGSKARARAFVLLAMFTTCLGLFVAVRRHQGVALSYPRLFALSVVVLAVLSTATFLGRRTLMQNLVGRRIVATGLLIALGVSVHRLVAWKLALRPEAVLPLDLVQMGMMVALAAATVTRWLWAVAATLLVGGAILAITGAPAETGFATVASTAFAAGAWSWHRFGARPTDGPGGASG